MTSGISSNPRKYPAGTIAEAYAVREQNVKVMLLEPFALKASATEEIWDTFESEVLLRAEVVKRLSDEFNLTFIPLQENFREACALQPASYWLADGVHPTPAGHQLIDGT